MGRAERGGDQAPQPVYLPEAVRQEIVELWEATGAMPSLEALDGRTWRLSLENDRVRMTMDLRRNASRNIRIHDTTLTVDGTEREPVYGVYEFANIFLDPPEGPPPPEPGQPRPLPPDRPADQAPPVVASLFLQLTRAWSRLPSVGYDGRPRDPVKISIGFARGRWVVALQGTGRRGPFFIYMSWERDFRGLWLPIADGFQVIVGGEDRTEEADGDVAKALQMAIGFRPPTGHGGSTGRAASAQAAARTNSVEVRRASVMRV